MRGAPLPLLLAALALAACRTEPSHDGAASGPSSRRARGASPGPRAPAEPRDGKGEGKDAADEPAWPGITLDLTPDPAQDELAVTLRLSGESAASIRALAVARRWADTRAADALGPVEVRDGSGPLALREAPPSPDDDDDGAVDRVLTLDRAPQGGELRVRYRVRANAGSSRFGLRLGHDRLSGVGHAFLLLPEIEVPTPTRIRWHNGALGAAPDFGEATSLGLGAEVVTTATSEELAHAVYLAGPRRLEEPRVSTAADQSPERRLVVFGAPAFDTRAAFYWAITALAAAGRFFDGEASAATGGEPFSFLLVAEPRIGASHDAASLTRSFGLWFDASRAFDAGLKSVIAHELVHRWIGGQVRLTDARGREAIWFSEGFTVHLARRLLLEARLVTPRDVLGDLLRTTRDPGRGAVSAEATCAEERAPRSQEEYRRGARYAAVLDRALRRASDDKRTLEDVVRALIARARATGRASTAVSVFRELVVQELGAPGGEDFDRVILRREPIDLPEDAFGPCFRPKAPEGPWEVRPCPGFR